MTLPSVLTTSIGRNRPPAAPFRIADECEQVDEAQAGEGQPLPAGLVAEPALQPFGPRLDELVPARSDQIARCVDIVVEEVFAAIRLDRKRMDDGIVIRYPVDRGLREQVVALEFARLLADDIDVAAGNHPAFGQFDVGRRVRMHEPACVPSGDRVEIRQGDAIENFLHLQADLDAGALARRDGNLGQVEGLRGLVEKGPDQNHLPLLVRGQKGCIAFLEPVTHLHPQAACLAHDEDEAFQRGARTGGVRRGNRIVAQIGAPDLHQFLRRRAGRIHGGFGGGGFLGLRRHRRQGGRGYRGTEKPCGQTPADAEFLRNIPDATHKLSENHGKTPLALPIPGDRRLLLWPQTPPDFTILTGAGKLSRTIQG